MARRGPFKKTAANGYMALGVLFCMILYVIIGTWMKWKDDPALPENAKTPAAQEESQPPVYFAVEAIKLKPWLDSQASITLVEVVSELRTPWMPLLPQAVRFYPDQNTLAQELPTLLGPNLRAAIVFYCPQKDQTPARKMAEEAAGLGYRQAHFLAGSLDDWLEAGLLGIGG